MALKEVGQTVYGFICVRDLAKAQGTETGSGMVVATGWGRGHGQLVSRGCGMAAEENEEVLWVDSDAQCTTTGLKTTEPQAENY